MFGQCRIWRVNRVLVVGSSILDHVYRVPSLPKEGQSVIASSYQTFPGGKGSNQAIACAKMGAAVSFCGCLGADGAAGPLMGALAAAGVDTACLVRSESPCGSASIMVAEGGKNLIVVAVGSNADLTPQDVAAAMEMVAPDYVLCQLEVPMECVREAATAARFILNPAPAAPLPREVLAKCFALTPNETEAEALTGIYPRDADSCLRCATALRETGAENVVLTLGEHGAFWLGDQGPVVVPPHPVQAVDTTAAGDVFNGALVAGLAQGMDFRAALGFASRAAALSTTKPGASASVPSLDEVMALA